jgi:hypothetical protein
VKPAAHASAATAVTPRRTMRVTSAPLPGMKPRVGLPRTKCGSSESPAVQSDLHAGARAERKQLRKAAAPLIHL